MSKNLFNKILLFFAVLSVLFIVLTIIAGNNKEVRVLIDFGSSIDVKPVDNELYQSQCGACHFAYQPGLLDERSWQTLTSTYNLSNHFGMDVTINDISRIAIIDYLRENSADKADYWRSAKIVESILPNTVSLRVSETPYIIRRHRKLVRQNTSASISLSNCVACHVQAKKGNYNEIDTVIPSSLSVK